MIGGLIGAAYFIITFSLAFLIGRDDVVLTMLIASLTNFHLDLLFVLLYKLGMPLSLSGQLPFQIIVGIAVNFILGGLIGSLIARILKKRRGKTK